MLSIHPTHAKDCRDFWALVEKIKERPSTFDRVPLPPSLAVVGYHGSPLHGEVVLCQVASPDAAVEIIVRN